MATILKGAPVAKALCEQLATRVAALKEKGIEPTLCIFRVGEREDDLSYERGATKRCQQVGIAVKSVVLPADVDQATFEREFATVNSDDSVHGVLLFRPLPEQLDGERARRMMNPLKDVDGCTDSSLASVYAGTDIGYPPCTAEAAMEILKFYDIDVAGKKAAVIGRSLVIGRPVSMMLLNANATVVTCHRRTSELAKIAAGADILIVASGNLHFVGPEFTNPGQTIIDVGINWDEARGTISGDVDFEAVEPKVHAITPTPGGVGSVTTSILVSHVVDAAERSVK